MAAAQAETLNSFVFNFASTSSQLQRRLVYALVGLPPVRFPLPASCFCPVPATPPLHGQRVRGCLCCIQYMPVKPARAGICHEQAA